MNNPKIKDIIVVARYYGKNPIGEALRGAAAGQIILSAQQRTDMIYRLLAEISHLMDKALAFHNQSSPFPFKVDLDYITRLSTNEFYFYTQAPLTLNEFEALQNRIAQKAKKLPQGLQFALGSFAVKTADSQVMNVIAHIACGHDPIFHFVVKNHSSSIDPRYKERQADGTLKTLRNADKFSMRDNMLSIMIDGRKCPISFNNVFCCKTPGGTEFFTAIDVCIDHQIGVAKANLVEQLRLDPTKNRHYISHMIISNWCQLARHHLLGGVVQTDPVQTSRLYLNQYRHTKSVQVGKPLYFGHHIHEIYELHAIPCPTVQEIEIEWELSVLDKLSRTHDYLIPPQMLGQRRLFEKALSYKQKQFYLDDLKRKINDVQIKMLHEQVYELETLKFGLSDFVMTDFIRLQKRQFELTYGSERKGRFLFHLQNRLNVLRSDAAICEMRNLIEHFRRKSGLLTIGMKRKAKLIEEFMAKVPIEERCAFLQSPSLQEALKILASHRIPFKKHLSKDGEIMIVRSANSYKQFKQKFFATVAADDVSKNKNEYALKISPE